MRKKKKQQGEGLTRAGNDAVDNFVLQGADIGHGGPQICLSAS